MLFGIITISILLTLLFFIKRWEKHATASEKSRFSPNMKWILICVLGLGLLDYALAQIADYKSRPDGETIRNRARALNYDWEQGRLDYKSGCEFQTRFGIYRSATCFANPWFPETGRLLMYYAPPRAMISFSRALVSEKSYFAHFELGSRSVAYIFANRNWILFEPVDGPNDPRERTTGNPHLAIVEKGTW